MPRSHIRARAGARIEGFGLAFAELPEPFAPRDLFDAPPNAPLELEIGSGKGSFLVAAAGAHPERLFLGVELARRYFRHAADRLRRRECANARIVHGDGLDLLLALPEGSLDGVHVYFPDPWPKRRHRNRRLVDAGFLEAVERALAPGALLRVATDFESYFVDVRAAAAGRAALGEVPYPPPGAAGAGEAAGSNFERKYLAEGRRIHRIAMARAAAPWVPSPGWSGLVEARKRRRAFVSG